MKRKRNANKTVGEGYVGRWASGEIGWGTPEFLTGLTGTPEAPSMHALECADADQMFEICRITIEVIPGRKKRSARALGKKL